MPKKEGIGIFTALAAVLILLGLLALAANYFGLLPAY